MTRDRQGRTEESAPSSARPFHGIPALALLFFLLAEPETAFLL